jgi:hypothetical protein
MQNNYKAWNIDFQDFYNQYSEEEKLRFLINFAVLAPSSYNTQPWSFKIVDNTICISADSNRSTPVGDNNNRQLHIGLGCALQNILIAADYYGYNFDVQYFPNGQENNPAAKISFNRSMGVKENKDHLVFFISKRQVNRNKFAAIIPYRNFLNQITGLSDQEINISLISDQTKKEQIADIVTQATAFAMADKSFRRELSC